jgi:hypothetical protein
MWSALIDLLSKDDRVSMHSYCSEICYGSCYRPSAHLAHRAQLMDVATKLLFREPLGFQSPEDLDEAESFLKTLDSAPRVMNKRRQVLSWTPIKLWLHNSYAADITGLPAFIDARVATALRRTSSGTPEKGSAERPCPCILQTR